MANFGGTNEFESSGSVVPAPGTTLSVSLDMTNHHRTSEFFSSNQYICYPEG